MKTIKFNVRHAVIVKLTSEPAGLTVYPMNQITEK